MSNLNFKIANLSTSKKKEEKIKFSLFSFLSVQRSTLNSVKPSYISKPKDFEVRHLNNKNKDVVFYKEYEKDENNNICMEVKKNSKGDINCYAEYTYNELNQKTMCTFYGKEHTVKYYTCYDYDTKGSLIKETRYNHNNVMDYYIEYVYTKDDVFAYKYGADGKRRDY